jgi:hypothetical protein
LGGHCVSSDSDRGDNNVPSAEEEASTQFFSVFLGVFDVFLLETPFFKGLRYNSECESPPDLPVVPIRRGSEALIEPANHRQNQPCPALIRGAYRDRHGRWVRDAVDVCGARDERA